MEAAHGYRVKPALAGAYLSDAPCLAQQRADICAQPGISRCLFAPRVAVAFVRCPSGSADSSQPSKTERGTDTLTRMASANDQPASSVDRDPLIFTRSGHLGALPDLDPCVPTSVDRCAPRPRRPRTSSPLGRRARLGSCATWRTRSAACCDSIGHDAAYRPVVHSAHQLPPSLCGLPH
jgi:hypothetical protein